MFPVVLHVLYVYWYIQKKGTVSIRHLNIIILHLESHSGLFEPDLSPPNKGQKLTESLLNPTEPKLNLVSLLFKSCVPR